MLKELIARVLPSWILRAYHRMYALCMPYVYGNPGKKLHIIGVTGTNGKSTTVALTGHILKQLGYTVAWMSTATERIGTRETNNTRKMTMPGHGVLQKFLRRAVSEGCTHAIIEVSSQGVSQFRNIGIPFDVGVFLNITPEHIEAHGSFEAYKTAKMNFFRYMSSQRYKKFGKQQARTLVVNLDDPYAPDFISVYAEKYIGTSLSQDEFPGFSEVICAKNITEPTLGHQEFVVAGHLAQLPLFGTFNISNALAAVGAAVAVGADKNAALDALASFRGVPGRIEFIQHNPFSVIVDYAPEPASLAALYGVVEKIAHKRIIHVFGSAGGGRDAARRPVMGSFVGKRADIAIITNEDPYDEDPRTIISQVAEGAREHERMVEGSNLFCIEDRREAIKKALMLAKEGDLVLITGKANEQWIMGPLGKKLPWDDRKVAREEIYKLQ